MAKLKLFIVDVYDQSIGITSTSSTVSWNVVTRFANSYIAGVVALQPDVIERGDDGLFYFWFKFVPYVRHYLKKPK